ncbi:MAG TPA: hypothetical protein VN328_05050 [Thermodesulfovibrionales bacterium]|nr:hypothetical protein [Thermodesulfovibrionales bacterium]
MPEELELFRHVYEEWKKHDVWFLMICGSRPIEDLGIIPSDRFAIYDLGRNKDRPAVHSVFGLGRQDSFYFIFDSAGKKVSASRSSLGYERGPKSALNELLTGTKFAIEELIERNHNIGEYEWLQPISEIIAANRGREYFIFSMFTKICDSCAGAEIIRFMKTIEIRAPKKILVASFLGRGYGELDIINLRSQLNIDYPVFIADGELRSKWDELIDKYNEDILSDIVFIVDSLGTILEVSHRTCNCFSLIGETVNRLINSQGEGAR